MEETDALVCKECKKDIKPNGGTVYGTHEECQRLRVLREINKAKEIKDSSMDRAGGKFNVNNLMIHLTYSYHPNLQKLLEHLNKIIKKRDSGNGIEIYSMVHETGEPGNREDHPHTHVAIRLVKALKTSDKKFFDYKCPDNPPSKTEHQHPHIGFCKFKKHFEYVCGVYHRKEKGEIYTNYEKKDEKEVKTVNKRNYDLDELKAVFLENGENGVAEYVNERRPNDITRVPSICTTVRKLITNENEERKKETQNEILELAPWHKHVVGFEIVFKTDRGLLYVYDIDGDNMKTLFAEYLQRTYKALYVTETSPKDVLYYIADENDKRMGEPIEMIVFDIPRAKKIDTELYETLELIKNGKFTAKKYQTREVNLGCKPFILVLSNTSPDIRKCTIDRWTVMMLDNGNISAYFTNKKVEEIHKAYMMNVGPNENYNVTPQNIWPIETYYPGNEYVKLIREIMESHRWPQVCFEPRNLTAKERRDKYIIQPTYSDVRSLFFEPGGKDDKKDKVIQPSSEQIEAIWKSDMEGKRRRGILPSEMKTGLVWDIKIICKDMKPEEIEQYEENKKRIEDEKNKYNRLELIEFEKKMIKIKADMDNKRITEMINECVPYDSNILTRLREIKNVRDPTTGEIILITSIWPQIGKRED